LVSLSFHSRVVGDIAVLECRGQIVEGRESAALLQHVDDLLAMHPHVLLHLGAIDFIDSSGVGLLVRVLTRTQRAYGKLALCSVSTKIREVLTVTRLYTIFDAYDAEAEAIAAFYRRPTGDDSAFRQPSILCVDKSPDVLAYVRALLLQAGYAVVTTTNLPDALILLTATRPKLVVIGTDLRAMRETQAAGTFNRLADALAVIELPGHFSTDDAGAAGRTLLAQVGAIIATPYGQAMM
jgi:anti-sigma B factor antagonist